MKIAYAAVDGGLDYRREARADHAARLEQLVSTAIAAKLSREKIDLLVFPAGYLQLRTERTLRTCAADVAGRLASEKVPFGVVWGMDVESAEKPRTKLEQQFDEEHPFFVSYRGASGELATYQQVSVTAAEGTEEVVNARWRDRPLVLPSTEIALLICGECWSDTLLKRVERSGCRALVVAAHRNVKMHRDPSGYGRLSWHIRLEQHQRAAGIPIVLAEHTRSPGRHPYAWPAEISAPFPLEEAPPLVSLRLATVP